MNRITKEKTMVTMNLCAGVLFLIVFAAIAIGAVKGGMMNLFWLPTALVILLLANRVLNRISMTREIYWLLVSLIFLEMLIAHWYVGRELEITYGSDESAQILAFGKYLASSGREGIYNRSYFAAYPRLYGSSFVLSLYYRLNYWVTGSYSEGGLRIWNQVLIDSAIFLAIVYGHMLGKELHVPAMGLRVELLCAFSPCYYLFQNLVCVQTLGMSLLIGGLLLCYRLFRSPKTGKRGCFFALLIGVYWGLTCIITPLGYFFAAAWLLTAFFRLEGNSIAAYCGAAVVSCAVVILAFYLLLQFKGIRTTEDVQVYQRPASYWLMVGLEPSGETDADRNSMNSLATLAERRELSWKMIQSRARKMGLAGVIQNSFRKVTTGGWQTGLFSNLENVNGTAYSRVRESWLDQFVNEKGLYTYSFARYANVLWIVTLFGAVAGYPMILLRKRFRHSSGLLMNAFSLLFVLLMGMICQSRTRDVLAVAPVIMVLSAYGFSNLAKLPELQRNRKKDALCQDPMFAELEEEIREAIMCDDIPLASARLRLYAQITDGMDFFINTTDFMQFENKRKAMHAKLEELNARNHLLEKHRTYREIWSKVNSCSAKELTAAKKSGEKLLQELMEYNESNAYALEGVQQQLQKKLIEIQKRLVELQPGG